MGSANDDSGRDKGGFLYDRLGSSEFSSPLVHVNKSLGDTSHSLQSLSILKNASDYTQLTGGSRSISLDDSGLTRSKLAFSQWRSQGSLLKELEEESREKQLQSDSLLKTLDSNDFDQDPFGPSDSSYDEESIKTLFFTSGSSEQNINNSMVSFIFNNFNMTEVKLPSLPYGYTSQFETFKTKFFDIVNQNNYNISFKRALLTVAFNHYGGHTIPGYMTLQEFLNMLNVQKNLFTNSTMAKFLFDCMDRKRKLMITLNDFIAGMLSCSPDADGDLSTPGGKLRLQHIFRAYDLKRLGYLDKTTLNVVLSHIHQLSDNILNTDDEQPNLYSYNSSSEIKLNKQLEDTLDSVLQKFDGSVGYDDFYSCVESGLISNVDLLLRSNKDFAKSVVDFIVFAVSNLATKPPANTDGVEHSSGNRSPASTPSVSHRKSSLWSTSSSKLHETIHTIPNSYKRTSEPPLGPRYQDIYSSESTKGGIFSDHPVEQSSNLYNPPGLSLKKEWTTNSHVTLKSSTGPDLNVDYYAKFNNGEINSTPNKALPTDVAEKSTKLHGTKSPDFTPAHVTSKTEATTEVENMLENRISDLHKRYRNRYIGFNTDIMIDDSIASKIFRKMYKLLFKSTSYVDLFSKFDWCTYTELIHLCDIICTLLKREDSLLALDGPLQIHGAMNGDLTCLIDIFNTYGWPLHYKSDQSQVTQEIPVKFLFVGGFTSDCGKLSLEFLIFLFSLKIIFPYHIYFLRGDKDNRSSTNKSGLYGEIRKVLSSYSNNLKLNDNEVVLLQYSRELLDKINNVFDHMSIAAFISGSILCVNGLISPHFSSLSQISNIPKPINIIDSSHDNVHVNDVLFGHFISESSNDDMPDASNGLTKACLHSAFELSGISTLVTSNDKLTCGYKYYCDFKVLQLSSHFTNPDNINKHATVAFIKEDGEHNISITHRTVKIN